MRNKLNNLLTPSYRNNNKDIVGLLVLCRFVWTERLHKRQQGFHSSGPGELYSLGGLFINLVCFLERNINFLTSTYAIALFPPRYNNKYMHLCTIKCKLFKIRRKLTTFRIDMHFQTLTQLLVLHVFAHVNGNKESTTTIAKTVRLPVNLCAQSCSNLETKGNKSWFPSTVLIWRQTPTSSFGRWDNMVE